LANKNRKWHHSHVWQMSNIHYLKTFYKIRKKSFISNILYWQISNEVIYIKLLANKNRKWHHSHVWQISNIYYQLLFYTKKDNSNWKLIAIAQYCAIRYFLLLCNTVQLKISCYCTILDMESWFGPTWKLGP